MPNKKILVLDDDPGIADVIEIILRKNGFDVFSLETKDDILKTTIRLQPDLILLDIWISGRDGREIFKELKAHPKTNTIPIIIISAKNDASAITTQLGADDFVAKPFDIDELVHRVVSHL